MKQRSLWRRALVVATLVAVAGVLLLRTERAGALVCETLRERLPSAVGTPVAIGSCEIDPLSATVRVRDVSVGPDGEPSVLTAAEASVALRGLFFGGVSLQQVTIIRPRVSLTLPLPPSANAKPGGCFVEPLKRLRLGEMEIENGTLVVHLPGGRSGRVDGIDVRARLARRVAEVNVSARSGALALEPGKLVSLGKLQAEGALDLDQAELELDKLEVSVEGATASLSGLLGELCSDDPTLDVNGQAYLPLPTLPRLGVALPRPQGQVWASFSATGHASAPTARGEVRAGQVVVGQFRPGDFGARVVLSGRRLSFDEVVTRSGDGEVKLSGHVELEPPFPVSATIESRNASFARALDRAGITGSWVEFPASVKGTVQGTLFPKPQLGGDIAFSTGAFSLTSRAWNAPAAEGRSILAFRESEGTFHLDVGDEGVRFDDVRISVGPEKKTRVRGAVQLFYAAERGIDVRASSESIDLSDFGAIAQLPWRGLGAVRVAVTGPTGNIAADGQVTLRDFNFDGYALGVVQSPVHYTDDVLRFPGIVAQKGQTQYFGDLALIFKDEGLHTRATIQMPDGRVEDVVDLLAELSTTVQNVQGDLVGRVSAVAAVDSPAKTLTGTIAMRMSDVHYLDRQLGSANVITRFEGGDFLVVDPTEFDGALGRMAFEGRWAFAGPLDYRLRLEDGSLAELIDPGGSDGTPIAGHLTMETKVGGDSDTVLTDSWMTVDDVKWKGRSLGPSRLDVKSVARDIQVLGRLFPGVEGQLSLVARNEWSFKSTLAVDLPSLSAFLPPSAGQLAAGVQGSLFIEGPMKYLDQIKATARLDRVSVVRGDISAANLEPVELAYNAGAFEVRSFQLKGPSTELSAQGRWGPATVDLKTRGSVDLRLVESFTQALERTSGRLDFTAVFSGSPQAPSLSGNARLDDARFAVRGQDLLVRGLTGQANFSENRILLQDVQGFLNDGRLRARGDVRLDKLSMKSMEMQTDLEDVTVRFADDVPATFSGSLLFASKGADQFLLTGAMDVVRFRYTAPLQLESILASARARGVPSEDKPREWLKLDVDVGTGQDVRLENNLGRARLLGKLKISGTNVKPVLIGALEVGEGAQAFFRGNTFSVSRASLQFNGLWPTFDFSAQSQVREYTVNVKAFGRFDDPRLSMTSDPALTEGDIVSLLTIGVTRNDRLADTSGYGLAAEAFMSASGLDQQLQRFLNTNVGLKDQQVRLTTSFNEATGTAEPTVSWESKVLTDNLKVGVTQPVTGKGTRAQVEYRFNQRVSARAQWDNQTSNTSVGNPGVDLRFRFEWE